MASDTRLIVKVGFDASDLIAGLRDAADAIEKSQELVAAHSRVTLTDALDEVESMVTQHCHEHDGTYDTSALSANRDAFALLVRAGRAEYVGEPYGRTAVIRLTPPDVSRGTEDQQ
jgi:hypothetical protein